MNEEEMSDRQLRGQFGALWTRTPSDLLNAPMRQELSKYRTIINNALSADALVRQRYNQNSHAISLLSLADVSISGIHTIQSIIILILHE